jgi:hypothetical protein
LGDVENILSMLGNIFRFFCTHVQTFCQSHNLCLVWLSLKPLLNLNHHHETDSVLNACCLGHSGGNFMGVLPWALGLGPRPFSCLLASGRWANWSLCNQFGLFCVSITLASWKNSFDTPKCVFFYRDQNWVFSQLKLRFIHIKIWLLLIKIRNLFIKKSISFIHSKFQSFIGWASTSPFWEVMMSSDLMLISPQFWFLFSKIWILLIKIKMSSIHSKF